MVQMVGVLIFALGLPDMFASLEHGAHVDNAVMVLGYVVMRVPMVVPVGAGRPPGPGARAGVPHLHRHDPVAQVGWVALLFAHTGIAATAAWFVVLVSVELVGPLMAETRGAARRGTPTTSRSATGCWSSSRSARA